MGADQRYQLAAQGYIRGIIGLPANLFYGTGIPACIVVLDKENAHANRGIFMLEILLIVASLGFHLGYLRAFSIGGLEAIAGNVLFLIPFELGAREGAYYVLFQLFGLDPQLGLYTSLVGRVRDFAWIAAGLLLILVIGPTPAPANQAGTAT